MRMPLYLSNCISYLILWSRHQSQETTCIMCQVHLQAALEKTGAMTSTHLHQSKFHKVFVHHPTLHSPLGSKLVWNNCLWLYLPALNRYSKDARKFSPGTRGISAALCAHERPFFLDKSSVQPNTRFQIYVNEDIFWTPASANTFLMLSSIVMLLNGGLQRAKTFFCKVLKKWDKIMTTMNITCAPFYLDVFE
jgi:hypothetical protein